CVAQLLSRDMQRETGLEPMTDAFALDVQKVMKGEAWRLVTYAFLHSTTSPLHIVFNMLFLWWFGREGEERIGTAEFVVFYLVAAAFAGLGFVLAALAKLHPLESQAVGASGAVFAVLLVSALHRPGQVVLLFFVIPMSIWVVIVFLLAVDAFALL